MKESPSSSPAAPRTSGSATARMTVLFGIHIASALANSQAAPDPDLRIDECYASQDHVLWLACSRQRAAEELDQQRATDATHELEPGDTDDDSTELETQEGAHTCQLPGSTSLKASWKHS